MISITIIFMITTIVTIVILKKQLEYKVSKWQLCVFAKFLAESATAEKRK